MKLPHFIKVGKFIAVITFGSLAKTLATGCPATCLLTKTYSTPLTALNSMSSTLTPWPRVKPWAALVQLPSASKAIFLAGPLTSSSTSGCLSANPEISKAKRRGVANSWICAKSIRSSFKKLATRWCNWAILLVTTWAGISSTPTSNKYECVITFLLSWLAWQPGPPLFRPPECTFQPLLGAVVRRESVGSRAYAVLRQRPWQSSWP